MSQLADAMDTISGLQECNRITATKMSQLEKEFKQLQMELSKSKIESETAKEETLIYKNDLKRVQDELVEQISRNSELEKAKEKLTDEIEDLTADLFTEANGMVANEARQRFDLEIISQNLKNELEQTRNRLKQETTQLSELKKQMEVALLTIKDSPDLTQLLGIAKQDFSFTFKDIFDKSVFDFAVENSELDEFRQFVERIKNTPVFPKEDPFIRQILLQEINPTLKFKNGLKNILDSLLLNTCMIEAKKSEEVCETCGSGKQEYRIKLNDKGKTTMIDSYCREKIVSVGDFFQFVRMIQLGLSDAREMVDLYKECWQLRRKMFYSRGISNYFISSDFQMFVNKLSSLQ